jgi:hypothetical protein
MFTARDLCAGVALPAGLSCLVLLVAWRLTRRRMSAYRSRSWAGPLAVGLGFVAGFAALFAWPELPPRDVVEWLAWLAMPLALAGTVEAWGGPSLLVRTIAAAAFSPLVVVLLAKPLLGRATVDGGVTSWQLATAAWLGLACLMTAGQLAQRVSAARFSAIQAATLVPASATLALAGSAWLGQMALLLAATQVGVLAAQAIFGRAALATGIALPLGVMFGGLLWYGCFYSNLSIWCALLLYLAPQIAWLSLEWPRQFSSMRRVGLQVASVALVACAALLLAWVNAPRGAY